MKLLPEVPTKDLLNYLRVCRGGITCTEFPPNCPKCGDTAEHTYANLYATAPDVKDEPVAYARTFNGEIMVDGLTLFADTADGELRQMNAEFPDDADKRKVIPLYAHPSPRIAALEAEVVKLRGAITNHKADFITDRELYEALK